MKPEILERQIAHAGYLTVERLRMRLTDGAEVSREVERHGDAAAVLPYDVGRRSALVVRVRGCQPPRYKSRDRLPDGFVTLAGFTCFYCHRGESQAKRFQCLSIISPPSKKASTCSM